MTRWVLSVAAAVALLSGPAAPASAQSPPPGSSWLEAGGFHHRVNHDFGNWTGGYARAVLSGRRDVWYLDARAQEAFKDRGVYGSLANVHSFSRSFYTQLGFGGGTGKYVLPDLRLDGSLNFKLGGPHALILTAGGTWVKSKSVYRDKALFAALTWAGPDVLVELGGRLNWSDPGAVRSERVSGALSLGRAGAALVILRGSVGSEGYQLTSAPSVLQDFRSQEAGLSWRQWLSGGFGTVLGGEWYHNPFYTRAGVSVGLFHAW